MQIDYRNPIENDAHGNGRAAAIVCTLLLALFATIAWMAVRGKSPTFDEPVHVVAGWEQLHRGDLRLDPENPPLWKYWAALPNGPQSLASPPTAEQMQTVSAATGDTDPVVVPALFRSDNTDVDRIVARSRTMMLVIAVAAGGVLGWWSWRLGGAVAAIAATAAFALDPNFLAHGPLVKNDVALALILPALAMAAWRAGQRVTIANAAAIALLCASAVNVKFTALLFGPIVALLLLARAMMPQSWPWLGRTLETRAARAGGALALCVLALLVSYVGIWACYGFRYAPANDPQARFDTTRIIQTTAFTELAMDNPGRAPTADDMLNWRPGIGLRAIFFLNDHRVLPEAWLTGLAYTRSVSIAHQNFLLGQHALTGWWYYFPFAMLVKAPLAQLIAAAGALTIGLFMFGRWRIAQSWTALCLIVPPAIYLLAAMSSNMQYGVRHVLAVFPFIFIGIGLAASHVWLHHRRSAVVAITVLAMGLIAETASAFPNYIPFFNAAAGGSRGGLRLLSCSNIDWGQDLKLLADWQRRHPDARLTLCYYGVAEPAYYGIRFDSVVAELPRGKNDVIAVSATYLQGLYLRPHINQAIEPLRHIEPVEVLGGSIYLFRLSK